MCVGTRMNWCAGSCGSTETCTGRGRCAVTSADHNERFVHRDPFSLLASAAALWERRRDARSWQNGLPLNGVRDSQGLEVSLMQTTVCAHSECADHNLQNAAILERFGSSGGTCAQRFLSHASKSRSEMPQCRSLFPSARTTWFCAVELIALPRRLLRMASCRGGFCP